jgi:AcrR family transcriptional regulator
MSVSHRDPELTRRQRGRASAIEEIKAAALDELRRHGASGVTMRGVARAIDMTPSGLYRYFDDHGALLSALCVDAHDSLSEALEAHGAAHGADDCGLRWFRSCLVLRSWALAHVDEYALVVGPRLPGVAADDALIAEAAERLMAFASGTVAQAIVDGDLVPGQLALALSPTGGDEPEGAGVPRGVATVTTGAVSALVGAVSLEAFGHLGGAAADREEHFRAYALEVMRSMGFVELPAVDEVSLAAS